MTVPVPPAAPGGPAYAVRRLRPEDAPGVTACVQRVYGETYVHAEVYHPEEIVRLNDSGELVSVVAVADSGEVVGHYALERPGLSAVAEEGEAMVLPEHRHHHLMEAMRELLGREADRLGLVGLFGRAVTNHVFSQRTWERFGLEPCGVGLGASPRTMHNMAEPLPQRMSLLLGFKYLRPPGRVTVHAPARHREVLAKTYARLGVQADLREGEAASGPGEVAATFNAAKQGGVIQVRRVGADSAEAVRRARHDLCERRGAEMLFLELPLSHHGTPGLCEEAERDGFFYSGLGPGFLGGEDALRLQYLTVPLDESLLQLDTDAARELVAYVARERTRVARGGPS